MPDDKIASRFPRVLENLRRLLGTVDELTLYDNSSSGTPYRVLARFESDVLVELSTALPAWTGSLGLPAFCNTHTRPIPGDPSRDPALSPDAN